MLPVTLKVTSDNFKPNKANNAFLVRAKQFNDLIDYINDDLTIIDNSITAIDRFVTKTYAEASALLSASELEQGTIYFISDKYLYLQSLDIDEFSLDGRLIARNADHDANGDYSGVTGYNSSLGIWHSGLTPAAGDVVIYNNLHYKNLTGSVGTAPSGDAVNWVVLAISTTTGYIYEIDKIEYDFNNDWIQKQIDKRGNIYKASYAVQYPILGYNPIPYFKWGSDGTTGNNIDEGYCDIRNFRGSFSGNTMLTFSDIHSVTGVVTSIIAYNIVEQSGSLSNSSMGANSYFNYNTIQQNVQVSNKTFDASKGFNYSIFNTNSGTQTISYEYSNIGKILTTELSLTTAQVKTLGTPISIIAAPGAGMINIVSNAWYYITYVSTPYNTHTNLNLIYDGGNFYTHGSSQGLNATVSRGQAISEQVGTGNTILQLIPNASVGVYCNTGNPQTGDSGIKVYVTYMIKML